ncbi:MAG: arginine--tRNA ligase [Candidatus Lloydbacteria bacterium RIFCSPHIGHO2_02_FULL_51_22]|uniref:Arginine--tRNA ligase n=2 Tax=Candidatus Lloydiibacteriota TaxID=1817910 RepID=A0A1G2DAN9_9BACT|nr:MAG: arginine--tRNA ligase [Candidatus Lloydbacteria bacterium RIFCSPHIGHO2_02_FULL_51_22]OGZ13897.1 MAG: arginine--tRNA ligase [Candidatus Lloydbacteria bacterium RIFCSPLOWO2_02_FULL_51_11]
MVSIFEHLKNSIHKALGEFGVTSEDIRLTYPEISAHGDVSTNVALLHAGALGKKPQELAELLKEKILGMNDPHIARIEVAGPGFINFYFSRAFYTELIERIAKEKDAYGKNEELAGKKIMVEYTDPNPFKEFHIGHLMSNAIGEALSRLLEFSGAEVKRANYQGDVGLHVAKALYGMALLKDAMPSAEAPLSERAAFLGKAYAAGATVPEAGKENYEKGLRELNGKIYDKSDPAINRFYDTGRKWSIEYFETIYKILGTHFDYYFFESESGPFGKKVVEENIPSIFQESDSATIFRGEKYGLHTRVFVTSQGLPTYEAKELGLAKLKYEKYPYDVSVVITGNEVRDYFKVVYKAMEVVFPDLAKKTIHIPHGMLRLPSGKMSSRTGDVITAEALIDEAKKLILEKMSGTDITNKEETAEDIAVGAIKYSILKNAPGNDIIFDFVASISFEGSSGPYLQYSYVRAKSVLEKAKTQGIVPSLAGTLPDAGGVERVLAQFEDAVLRAREGNAPQYMATYLTELARAFNSFYAHEHIADSPYRLALAEAVAVTLKNGLWLLGIRVPERM